jgi:4'-phosphopantetheinyl transferase
MPDSWLPAPADDALNDDAVHVWRVDLAQPDEYVRILRDVLSSDELKRADSFYFQHDRRRFIVGRGALRTILGRYLGAPADRLCFTYTLYGKPQLSSGQGSPALQFNVSHSDDLALCAVARGRIVGVDLERIRANIDYGELAERFFSRAECAMLLALPAPLKLQGFFNCWTRKEAYIKARGEGLSLPLNRFTVSLAPDRPAQMISAEEPGEVVRWSICELHPSPGYAAALIGEGRGWRIAYRRWQANAVVASYAGAWAGG